ncbi:MAG: hypothetical protein C7B47_05875 [Sulfobacillus thermosulfidooxidans]|uniref:Uncharacterized protein n=1 Tax=Sulfobacillus thermosulfidooxidans TaxID=28034 RepID=A0A2T2X165_SULTH|nr:MAG: hypothetical protein C7B47_05875 [Sulfobacillus thermosulfidooxidans]
MIAISKRKFWLVGILAILAFLLVYPQKTREYQITKTGRISYIGQGFDGGFVAIEVDSTIFDDPVINTPSNSIVSLPPHLHIGQNVKASGKWVAKVPWWTFYQPSAPHVVTLTALSLMK